MIWMRSRMRIYPVSLACKAFFSSSINERKNSDSRQESYISTSTTALILLPLFKLHSVYCPSWKCKTYSTTSHASFPSASCLTKKLKKRSCENCDLLLYTLKTLWFVEFRGRKMPEIREILEDLLEILFFFYTYQEKS